MNWQNIFEFLAYMSGLNALIGLVGGVAASDYYEIPFFIWFILSFILTIILGSLAVEMK